MKSKLIVAILILIMAVALVGCHGSNEEEQGRDTVYLSITNEEFVENIKKYTSLSAYDDVNGYKFDLMYRSDAKDNMFEFDLKGIIDISNFEDVSFSVNAVRKYDQKPSSGSGNGQSGGSNGTVTVAAYNSKTTYNAYLYNHTLYFDLQESNKQIKKDSIKNINNNFADMLDLIIGDSAFDFDGYVDTSIDIFNDFADYTQILYCEDVGHYIIDVDFSDGDEIDDEEIDPFTFGIDLFVGDERITEARIDFISRDVKINGYFKEDAGNIDHPDDPDSYVGTLLDELEQILFTEISDFYGEWEGYIRGKEDYLVLDFSEQGATLTVVNDEGEDVIEFVSSDLKWGIVTLVSEDGIYLLQLEGDVIILTMPDDTEVYMAKI